MRTSLNFSCPSRSSLRCGREIEVNKGHDASGIRYHASPIAETGIALIIVMISILVLAVLAGGFAWSMKVETRLAYNANSEDELEWLGRSGVEYARWILAQELQKPVQYDALNQVWAGGPGDIATTNTALMFVEKEVHLGHGSFTWKITDCERKANINTASEVLLQQAMLQDGVDPSESAQIIGAILDWIDPDNTVHLQGAESDYYQSLNPPYEAKNGPIDDLSELLLVKGITPEIYWGPASSNNIPGMIERKLNRFGSQANANAPAYTVGLVELFTPISYGKINLNTASASVLQMIPGVDNAIANAIVAGRQGEDDGSGLLGPYRNINDLQRVPEVPRGIIGAFAQFCDVRSKTFEVQIDAQVGNYKRTFYATLGRNNPKDIQTLIFYWK